MYGQFLTIVMGLQHSSMSGAHERNEQNLTLWHISTVTGALVFGGETYRENDVFLEVRDLVKFLLHFKDAKQFPAGNLVVLTINISLQQAEKVRLFWQLPNVANTPREPVHRTIQLDKFESIVISPMMPEKLGQKAKGMNRKNENLIGKKHTLCIRHQETRNWSFARIRDLGRTYNVSKNRMLFGPSPMVVYHMPRCRETISFDRQLLRRMGPL